MPLKMLLESLFFHKLRLCQQSLLLTLLTTCYKIDAAGKSVLLNDKVCVV